MKNYVVVSECRDFTEIRTVYAMKNERFHLVNLEVTFSSAHIWYITYSMPAPITLFYYGDLPRFPCFRQKHFGEFI